MSFNGKIFVDYLARFENIKDDWKYIAKKINEDSNLPHENKSIHKHYTKHYDSESIQIVSNIYAEDIKILGYMYGI